jgi:hypothetical protein
MTVFTPHWRVRIEFTLHLSIATTTPIAPMKKNVILCSPWKISLLTPASWTTCQSWELDSISLGSLRIPGTEAVLLSKQRTTDAGSGWTCEPRRSAVVTLT